MFGFEERDFFKKLWDWRKVRYEKKKPLTTYEEDILADLGAECVKYMGLFTVSTFAGAIAASGGPTRWYVQNPRRMMLTFCASMVSLELGNLYGATVAFEKLLESKPSSLRRMTEQLISLSPHSSSIRERYQHTSAIKGLELREAREGTEMYGVELDIGADSSWNNNNHNHNGSGQGQGQGQGNSVNDMKTVDMNNMGIYTNENANANGDVSQDQVLQSIDHLTMNDGESAHINRGLPGYMRSDQETVIRSDGGLK